MEIVAKTPNSLSLPWKTRIKVGLLGFAIDLGMVNRRLMEVFLTRIPPTLKPINGLKTYDVVVNPSLNIWFRVYVPTEHALEDLPLIVYFHGGGFALLGANVNYYDDMCRNFARKLPAIVVSVEYRRPPEHPHPAQYDDGIDVLKFLDDEENRSKCLLQNANISRCFLAGDSAGGNLAHYVAQRACSQTKFKQLKVIGLVAIVPFFGGEERTNSEKELDGWVPLLTTKRTDWFWKVFMPQGEGYSRDHPSINVSGPKAMDISKVDFPATLVVVAGFDILHDWQKKYYEWLLKSGKEVELAEYPNMFHNFFWFPEMPESDRFFLEVKDFVYKVFNSV